MSCKDQRSSSHESLENMASRGNTYYSPQRSHHVSSDDLHDPHSPHSPHSVHSVTDSHSLIALSQVEKPKSCSANVASGKGSSQTLQAMQNRCDNVLKAQRRTLTSMDVLLGTHQQTNARREYVSVSYAETQLNEAEDILRQGPSPVDTFLAQLDDEAATAEAGEELDADRPKDDVLSCHYPSEGQPVGAATRNQHAGNCSISFETSGDSSSKILQKALNECNEALEEGDMLLSTTAAVLCDVQKHRAAVTAYKEQQEACRAQQQAFLQSQQAHEQRMRATLEQARNVQREKPYALDDLATQLTDGMEESLDNTSHISVQPDQRLPHDSLMLDPENRFRPTELETLEDDVACIERLLKEQESAHKVADALLLLTQELRPSEEEATSTSGAIAHLSMEQLKVDDDTIATTLKEALALLANHPADNLDQLKKDVEELRRKEGCQ